MQKFDKLALMLLVLFLVLMSILLTLVLLNKISANDFWGYIWILTGLVVGGTIPLFVMRAKTEYKNVAAPSYTLTPLAYTLQGNQAELVFNNKDYEACQNQEKLSLAYNDALLQLSKGISVVLRPESGEGVVRTVENLVVIKHSDTVYTVDLYVKHS